MLGMVLGRVVLMRRHGIEALNFGKIDKSDFLILPFALFYFYIVIANAFNFISVTTQELFHSETVAWIGVIFCIGGLLLIIWSLISFGQSFRIGIDLDNPDQLITSGVFAYSRNPIYVAFAMILFGQFLIFSNWILLSYFGAALWLFHRQVLREEDYLKVHYGKEYSEYCYHVRRYF